MTKDKIEKLIAQLTLQEKIGMIHGNGLFETKGVERLGIPPFRTSDGPRGVRKDFENDTWKDIGLSYDYASYLPCNTALAATWNRALAMRRESCSAGRREGAGRT